MGLDLGTRLGAYEITGELGVGGMGEVYRASDTKLGREVAIKTLPSALAQDADRLARFEREAKLLAALNHAHIAAIYGLDEHEGTQYLAMELVEGETLEKKLEQGPLPVEDALRLGLQIAEALEVAHERGVVHRDLKPANIMVSRDGQVKVLDFGLAKAFSGDPDEASPAHSPALSLAMTQQGLVLGTAGYMAPEQASGQATDQRADIWAFGVVLYEMLTGMPVFSGESVPHILAAVLQTEPDWTRLPKNLHPRLRLLLERCLTKKLRSRLHSMADARVDIEAVLSDPAGVEPTAEGWQVPRARALATAVIMTFSLMAGLSAVLVWRFWPAPGPGPLTRFVDTIELPGTSSTSAITRDGVSIAFVAGNPPAIYVREMGELGVRPIADTVEYAPAGQLCFSPDGAWVAFRTADRRVLRRAPIAGGPGLAIAEDLSPFGARQPCDWADDGYIYFASARGISRVRPVAGASPESILSPDTSKGDLALVNPQLLPGGTQLLFGGLHVVGGSPRLSANIADLVSRRRSRLLDDAGFARFAPSGPDGGSGHLVFGRDDRLYAAPFDLERLELDIGAARSVAENVLRYSPGEPRFSLSMTGTLVFMTGESIDPARAARSIDVLDRNGKPSTLRDDGRPYVNMALSPDGQAYVTSILGPDPTAIDLSRYDLAGGPPTRLTFGGRNDAAVWTADSQHVIFLSLDPEGPQGPQSSLQSIRADGREPPITLWQASGFQQPRPDSISPDRRTLIGTDSTGIWMLSLENPPKDPTNTELQYVLRADFAVAYASFSPDGHWIAYSSDETGGEEVHVIPFPYPGAGGHWQVSVDGGAEPRWNPSGGELFFRNGARFMVADVETDDGFRVIGQPRELFEDPSLVLGARMTRYGVSPDGTQFVMLRRATAAPDESTGAVELHVVQNWFDELDRIVPLE